MKSKFNIVKRRVRQYMSTKDSVNTAVIALCAVLNFVCGYIYAFHTAKMMYTQGGVL